MKIELEAHIKLVCFALSRRRSQLKLTLLTIQYMVTMVADKETRVMRSSSCKCSKVSDIL